MMNKMVSNLYCPICKKYKHWWGVTKWYDAQNGWLVSIVCKRCGHQWVAKDVDTIVSLDEMDIARETTKQTV